MSYKVAGKCSNCGSEVRVPTAHHGINNPVPKCSGCGYVKSSVDLPEIKMRPINESGQKFLQD